MLCISFHYSVHPSCSLRKVINAGRPLKCSGSIVSGVVVVVMDYNSKETKILYCNQCTALCANKDIRIRNSEIKR